MTYQFSVKRNPKKYRFLPQPSSLLGATALALSLAACSGGGGGSNPGGGVDPNNPDNTLPEFTSGTNGTIIENATLTDYVAAATDADGDALTYLIVADETSGPDTALFSIDGSTGELSFIDAPDFEAPADADSNNLYELTISVRDLAGDTASIDVSIAVLDETSQLELTVTYPTPNANVGIGELASQVEVSGYIADLEDGELEGTEIDSLYLNGNPVTFDQNSPSRWSANTLISSRVNTLEFELLESGQNASTASLFHTIISEELIFDGGQIAYDVANSRALIINSYGEILAMDLGPSSNDANGMYPVTIFSDNVTGQDGLPENPVDIVIDADANRALVLNNGEFDAIIAIDLDSAESTFVSTNSSGGPNFYNPVTIALNASANRAYTIDDNDIFEVNLTSGDRSPVSSDIFSTGPEFSNPTDMVYDATANQLLVTDRGLDALIAISLDNSGDRRIISDDNVGSGPELNTPRSLYLDQSGDTPFVVVADADLDALVSIDLSNGNRTVISGDTDTSDLIGTGSHLFELQGLTYDSDNQQYLLIDRAPDRLFAIDPDTGDRTALNGVGSGPIILGPVGAAIDHASNRLLVMDSFLDILISVDLDSGDRTVLSDNSDEGPEFGGAADIVLDADANRVLVVDAGLDAVLAIDLDTAARTMVSDNSGDGPDIASPDALTLDAINQRVFILDNDNIFDLNLVSGERTYISSAIIGSLGPEFINTTDMVYDAENNQLLVSDQELAAIISVSLDSDDNGNRTIISGGEIGGGSAMLSPQSLAIDYSTSPTRALVLDNGEDSLLAVDIETGNRKIVSGYSVDEGIIGTGPTLSYPVNLTLDDISRRVFIADSSLNGIVVVDLETGNRAVSSQ